MTFNYKNPVSPLSTLGNISVSRSDVFGTNFSILGTGGYMEVYTLNDLYFNVPSGTTGLVEFSGNTIPIQLNIGGGTIFSPDVLTLNSDNISSGRRRIGMLVYVIDEDQIYQYQIPNFESLWSGATGATGPGGPTVIFSEFGTTIKSNTPEGVGFISAWTANTIEGVSGETSLTAVWKKLVTGGGGTFTGGTVTGDTIFTNGLTATTFSAGTYLGLPVDVFVTGGTYSGDTITLTNNTGGTFDITGITTSTAFTGGTVTGDTLFTGGVTATTFSAGTYLGLPLDVFVTGGTYTGGTITFTNNSGGTFSISGLYTGGTDFYVTGGTFNKNTETLTLNRNDGSNVQITGFTDVFVTGGTYSNNTFTYTNKSGGTFSVTFNIVTGLTVNGNLTVTGTSNLNGTIVSNSLSGSTDRVVQVNSGGTFSATQQIITAYISSGSTVANLLENTSNWDINGNYTGAAITGTFQGQRYYDGNYFYEAVSDNLFVRLIRG